MRKALLKIGLVFFILSGVCCLVGFFFATAFDGFVDAPGVSPEGALIGRRARFAGFMLSFVGYAACLVLLVRGPRRER